jgi:hypothetical protein
MTTLVVDFRRTTVFTVVGTTVIGTITGLLGNNLVGGSETVITGPTGTDAGMSLIGIEVGKMVVSVGWTAIVW